MSKNSHLKKHRIYLDVCEADLAVIYSALGMEMAVVSKTLWTPIDESVRGSRRDVRSLLRRLWRLNRMRIAIEALIRNIHE